MVSFYNYNVYTYYRRISTSNYIYKYCRTKVECAGLCLATKDCYAFHWEESEFTCTLMAEEGMCFDGKESTSIVVYADQAKNLPRCPGMVNSSYLLS